MNNITEEALKHAVAHFTIHLNRLKSFDLEEMADKKAAHYMKQIEQYEEMKTALEALQPPKQPEIISCTEAGKLLESDKETVRQMVFNGELKNYGNQHRPMVNRIDIVNLKKRKARGHGKVNKQFKYNEEMKFDFAEMMNRKRKVKIIVTEKNKPNLDKMAEAFYQLLKK